MPQYRVDRRLEIGLRPAAKAVEQRKQFQAAQRRFDVVAARRQQQRGAVLQQLDQHAAGAERHHRAEHRIAGDADDQLGDAALHHALDIEAGAERRHRRGRRADGLGVPRLSLTAPASDLVGDAERLERHRKAERHRRHDALRPDWRRARPSAPESPAGEQPALASASSGVLRRLAAGAGAGARPPARRPARFQASPMKLAASAASIASAMPCSGTMPLPAQPVGSRLRQVLAHRGDDRAARRIGAQALPRRRSPPSTSRRRSSGRRAENRAPGG